MSCTSSWGFFETAVCYLKQGVFLFFLCFVLSYFLLYFSPSSSTAFFCFITDTVFWNRRAQDFQRLQWGVGLYCMSGDCL